MINPSFWNGKRVFVTGHTGFKGSWLSLWLIKMGAKVTGYSLAPTTNPNLYGLLGLDSVLSSHIGNINNLNELSRVMRLVNPEIVFHMAAQPIVGESYQDPLGTFQTNVIGTINLLEAIRSLKREGSKIKTFINVTTDKCYENKELVWGYRETDPLGGKDPYSASKACSEIVTTAYRESFFPLSEINDHGVSIATARAGNVIGGGDWSPERLIPQCIEALSNNHPIFLRRPNAIRPWQHVLEPLSGYLLLAEKMYQQKEHFGHAWNFGPEWSDCQSVGNVVNKLINLWGSRLEIQEFNQPQYNESNLLMLDCSKSKKFLGWQPIWKLDQALEKIVEWHQAYLGKGNIIDLTHNQIDQFLIDLQPQEGNHE